jgi:hypothetical protein
LKVFRQTRLLKELCAPASKQNADLLRHTASVQTIVDRTL